MHTTDDQKYLVLKALADQQDVDYVLIAPLFERLNIPKEERGNLFDILYHSRYVDGPPTLPGHTKARITPKGLDYLNGIEEKYYNTYRKPMNPKNVGVASLNETCERLFQMHKESGYTIEWTKETFDNQRGDLNNAKEKMLEEGILKAERDWKETKLKSEFWHLGSYSEALKSRKSSEDRVSSTVHNNIYGDNNPVNVATGINVNQNNQIRGLSKENHEELRFYGLNQAEIDELETAVSTSNDKPSLAPKAMKWLGSVSAAVAGRGLYEHLPQITDFVQKLIL